MGLRDIPGKAARFRELHRSGHTFVLPTVWDAGSARIFADAGFLAVGTTSGGITFSMARPDGEPVPRDEMLAVVRHIVTAVDVPVSADLEAGYGATPAAVADTTRAAMAAGAVGMILQDWLPRERRFCTIDEYIDRLKAARAAAQAALPAFVINARTEIFLERSGDPDQLFTEAVTRLRAYRKAGADCLFVPGIRDGATIERMVRAVEGPLNIIPGPDSPRVADLAWCAASPRRCGTMERIPPSAGTPLPTRS